MKDSESHGKPKSMSNLSFRLMSLSMRIEEFLHPRIDKRVKTFGILEGMTVVDYGCGPGRYTIRFSKIVGENGKVYAVDIQELAIKAVKKKIEKYNLKNVEPILAKSYNSGLPDNIADIVTVIDMIFMIPNPEILMKEIHRITKKNGFMIIDYGHKSQMATKDKILPSGCWEIIEETQDYLKCKPT
jgi:ubiquinone/menaquinone biosynthesis C-methylase UbiE